MGFFKRELNKAIKKQVNKAAKPKKQTKKQASQNQSVMSVTPWTGCPEYAQLVEVGGDCEKTIYVYDSEPLKGVRKGQTVTVEIYRGDMIMRSVHTGTVANSAEFDDVVVGYDGHPIGFTSLPRSEVINSAHMGYVLHFKAKCYGMLEGYPGCKEMRLLAPKRFALDEWTD